ncbi:hypothetical protein [Roseibium aggregatum]|uniref:Uncharacterized protein n=1 Tax=Roseibium aggregatum TaxID=187304 RepID=A0A939J3Z2_9HYPH|nr:hypothetical protein [Roseibium aggregatum]MBN9670154.1 hypothetical protein [Roseibium aggregatum]
MSVAPWEANARRTPLMGKMRPAYKSAPAKFVNIFAPGAGSIPMLEQAARTKTASQHKNPANRIIDIAMSTPVERASNFSYIFYTLRKFLLFKRGFSGFSKRLPSCRIAPFSIPMKLKCRLDIASGGS